MVGVRTTIVLDGSIAARVKQMFNGNLSRGVNSLLAEHLAEGRKDSAWGLMKGKGSVKDLRELQQEDIEAEKEHDGLYSRL